VKTANPTKQAIKYKSCTRAKPGKDGGGFCQFRIAPNSYVFQPPVSVCPVNYDAKGVVGPPCKCWNTVMSTLCLHVVYDLAMICLHFVYMFSTLYTLSTRCL
jgi:hypothetical protein